MSSTLPQGINTPTAIQATTDVYSKMLKSAVEAAIEDIILVDESQSNPTNECTCGQCGAADLVLVEDSGPARSLAGAPMLYIEARANSAPLVLDEHTVSADIERIAPRWVQTPLAVSKDNDVEICMAPTAEMLMDEDFLASINPQSFDPFDPGVIAD